MALAMVKIQAAALPRGILTMLKCFGAVAAGSRLAVYPGRVYRLSRLLMPPFTFNPLFTGFSYLLRNPLKCSAGLRFSGKNRTVPAGPSTVHTSSYLRTCS
jgi:hypothetical protein